MNVVLSPNTARPSLANSASASNMNTTTMLDDTNRFRFGAESESEAPPLSAFPAMKGTPTADTNSTAAGKKKKKTPATNNPRPSSLFADFRAFGDASENNENDAENKRTASSSDPLWGPDAFGSSRRMTNENVFNAEEKRQSSAHKLLFSQSDSSDDDQNEDDDEDDRSSKNSSPKQQKKGRGRRGSRNVLESSSDSDVVASSSSDSVSSSSASNAPRASASEKEILKSAALKARRISLAVNGGGGSRTVLGGGGGSTSSPFAPNGRSPSFSSPPRSGILSEANTIKAIVNQARRASTKIGSTSSATSSSPSAAVVDGKKGTANTMKSSSPRSNDREALIESSPMASRRASLVSSFSIGGASSPLYPQQNPRSQMSVERRGSSTGGGGGAEKDSDANSEAESFEAPLPFGRTAGNMPSRRSSITVVGLGSGGGELNLPLSVVFASTSGVNLHVGPDVEKNTDVAVGDMVIPAVLDAEGGEDDARCKDDTLPTSSKMSAARVRWQKAAAMARSSLASYNRQRLADQNESCAVETSDVAESSARSLLLRVSTLNTTNDQNNRGTNNVGHSFSVEAVANREALTDHSVPHSSLTTETSPLHTRDPVPLLSTEQAAATSMLLRMRRLESTTIGSDAQFDPSAESTKEENTSHKRGAPATTWSNESMNLMMDRWGEGSGWGGADSIAGGPPPALLKRKDTAAHVSHTTTSNGRANNNDTAKSGSSALGGGREETSNKNAKEGGKDVANFTSLSPPQPHDHAFEWSVCDVDASQSHLNTSSSVAHAAVAVSSIGRRLSLSSLQSQGTPPFSSSEKLAYQLKLASIGKQNNNDRHRRASAELDDDLFVISPSNVSASKHLQRERAVGGVSTMASMWKASLEDRLITDKIVKELGLTRGTHMNNDKDNHHAAEEEKRGGALDPKMVSYYTNDYTLLPSGEVREGGGGASNDSRKLPPNPDTLSDNEATKTTRPPKEQLGEQSPRRSTLWLWG